MQQQTISVIIPVYNEEEVLPELFRVLDTELNQLHEAVEYVCVNDGSQDASLAFLRQRAQEDSRLKVVDLSRNFGHQVAITAGMEHATGDCAVIIDADLQDPPSLIPRMVELWKQDYQVVYAKRSHRKGEGFFKLFFAKMFYRMLKRVTQIDIPLDTGDFRLIDRKVIDALKAMPEQYRFIRGMVAWVGFNQIGIEYDRQERFKGETKYPFKKSLALAIDGIISFSFFPLRLATYLGFVVSALAFLYALYIIYREVFTNYAPQGWPSLMVATLFMGGILLIILGIVGEYIGRSNMEVKRRPNYLIREIIQKEEADET